MCWNAGVTVAMVGVGAVATVVAVRRGEPGPIWGALAYFTLMEALQAAGYGVVDECGSPANRAVTLLSYLHIVFQPFFINAFAMALMAKAIPALTRRIVWGACIASALVMLAQLVPLDALGQCKPGQVLCGPALCTVSCTWHIGWEIPLNGMFSTWTEGLPFSLNFPSYVLAVFVVPLIYGAWRFVVFHAAFGPILANLLTDDPREIAAIWCLFSIGLVLMSMSPLIRRQVSGPVRA